MMFPIYIKLLNTSSLLMDYSSKAVMLLCKINHFAYRCILLGEHRPLLADLLWNKAQNFIQEFERISKGDTREGSTVNKLTEEQI